MITQDGTMPNSGNKSMKMEKLKGYMAYILLLVVIVFNLVVLKGELNSLFDVNDNVFAFTLIERANDNWQECLNQSSGVFKFVGCYTRLLDHWNSTWAMGYPLPHFYQHLPANTIVFVNYIFKPVANILPANPNIGKVFDDPSLYTIFNFFKYLMLCFYPLALYLASRRLKLSKVTASITALSSFLIANNFQYGSSWESIVWRGSGMYTQLWGMIFLPLAVAFCFEAIIKRRSYFWAILLLVLTIVSQLGFGFIVAISVGVILLVQFLDYLIAGFYRQSKFWANILSSVKKINLRGFALIFALTGVVLAYWMVPLLANSNYHNHSVWDDLLKFNSYGARVVISRLFNSEVFDYARGWPTLTLLVMVGFFVSLAKYFKAKAGQVSSKLIYLYLPVLMLIWILFYFGRTTWGGLIDLIPLSGSMHWHRVINGVHLAGFFLAGIGGVAIIELLYSRVVRLLRIKGSGKYLTYGVVFLAFIGLWFYPAVYERYLYIKDNNKMIVDYNTALLSEWDDLKQIIDELERLPRGRIFLGKPGQWGSELKIGGQSLFMTFSIAGFDVLGFLPETWSPNSDIEQFFGEDKTDHYRLFDIRYVVADKNFKAPKFLREVKRAGRFILYETPSKGVFHSAVKRGTVYTDKRAALNFNHFIINGPGISELNLWEVKYSKPSSLRGEDIKTLDWSSYKTSDGKIRSLFEKSPFKGEKKAPSARFWNEKVGINSYETEVELGDKSMILLSTTYHPFWKATVDGVKTEIIMLSPALMGLEVDEGKHKIVFHYQISNYKYALMLVSFVGLVGLFLLLNKKMADRIFG